MHMYKRWSLKREIFHDFGNNLQLAIDGMKQRR